MDDGVHARRHQNWWVERQTTHNLMVNCGSCHQKWVQKVVWTTGMREEMILCDDNGQKRRFKLWEIEGIGSLCVTIEENEEKIGFSVL